MTGIKVTVTGTRELEAKLKRVGEALTGQALANATLAGGLVIEAGAKEKVHVVTGNLRRSIHTAIESSTETYASVLIGTDVEYAPYEELGTRYRPPHPYLRPALDEKKGEANKVIRDAYRELILKAAQ